MSATPAAPPTQKARKHSGSAVAAVTVGLGGLGGVEGIEAAARRGACVALGDLASPTTTDIVSAVVAGLGKSRLNISKGMRELSRTSLATVPLPPVITCNTG